MTDRVHQVSPILANPHTPVTTACGQRDGELGPEGFTHYVTINGRVTCPDCLRAAEPEGQLAWEWAS